jgi:4-diphosphocytidyl-2-C-methyl-D-erythritol kinase
MDVPSSSLRLTVETPAKLNLFLEVIAKREDGFHEIETLMTVVNIYDRLSVSALAKGQTQLTSRWASGMEPQAVSRNGPRTVSTHDLLPKESDNIVWRAVDRLRQRSGTNHGIAIDLVKRIPAAAGLGGASSDAAATLVAANRLWGLDWSRERLADVAAELGSDIPFFLGRPAAGAGMAVCRGRGEQIEALHNMPPLHFVVVKPQAGLSTPAVYQRCKPATNPKPSAPLVEALRRGRCLASHLLNRLEEAAQQVSPLVGQLRSVFERTDCLAHQMSGSGSSYFGVCRSGRQARRLASRIRGLGFGQVFHAVTAPHAHRLEAAPQ